MRADILGIAVDTYSMSETVALICRSVENGCPRRVVTANPELIYRARKNSELQELLNSADIVTADGVGVVWAARQLGTPVAERVTGIDLIKALFPFAGAGGWRIFFLGGKQGVAEQAARQTARENPGIIWEAGHGYFRREEEEGVIANIRSFQPDVLLLGLGAPRQEYWLAAHPGLATVGIGVGGSFDALAGVVPRAPKLFQDLRLEWLYRLGKEPWRWRRQSVLPRFVVKVLKQRLNRRKNRAH